MIRIYTIVLNESLNVVLLKWQIFTNSHLHFFINVE